MILIQMGASLPAMKTISHNGSAPGTTRDLQFNKTGDSGYLLMTNMDASTPEHLSNWNQLAPQVHNLITEFTINN